MQKRDNGNANEMYILVDLRKINIIITVAILDTSRL